MTDSKGAPFSYALLKVINWWTTFLLPTVEQWQESSWIDADVSYLIDRIKTKRKVVLASLICKRCYSAWTKGQLEDKDDNGADQTNSATRVPTGLRQVTYTAYHATPMAGHVGFYKTHWRMQ